MDIQKYDDGSISYCLTSQITFSNKQSDTELSKHTGKYSCREIGNISNSASVYVFASSKHYRNKYEIHSLMCNKI